jgi:hypothetical protein
MNSPVRFPALNGLAPRPQWTFYVTVSPRSDSLTVWRALFWNGTEMVVDCGKFGKLDDEFRPLAAYRTP